jgi:hypothetical protein
MFLAGTTTIEYFQGDQEEGFIFQQNGNES